MKTYLCCIALLFQVSCSNNYFERESNDKYTGIIRGIYVDKGNHGVTMFDIECLNQTKITIIADYYLGSKKFAEVGDSIIKKKGDAFFLIKKNYGEKENKVFITKFKKKI